MRKTDLTGVNIRDVPAYPISVAAHYLQIPAATVRSWVCGRDYPVAAGTRRFKPVIQLPERSRIDLSFTNLVEAYVLDAIRRRHKVHLYKVRRAIEFLQREFGTSHPLADEKLQTEGCDLFVEKYGALINVSRDGQLAMKQVMASYLRRIEWDEGGVAKRLYPFVRKDDLDEPKVVVIDPEISFGRPVLVGTGIPTLVIAERYKAGESIDELAEDYRRERIEIEQAIRCELELKAA